MNAKLSSKKDLIVVSTAIILLVFLALHIVYTICYMFNIEKSKQSGNERWKRVEERILLYENKVDTLEKEIEEWKK